MEENHPPLIVQEVFFPHVWKIARLIPRGKVFSYGQIAQLIPAPEGIAESDYKAYRARWAGQAMNACPSDVPWQRVINAQGKISYRGGSERQRRLLEAEGVTFDERERADLTLFGWEGPDTGWLRANGLLTVDQPQQGKLF